MDLWAGGRVHPFEIRFNAMDVPDQPLCLGLGLSGGAPNKRSRVVVNVNDGDLTLTGDRGPIFSISCYTMTALNLVADGRNGSGNRAPRTIGSSAGRLMTLIDEHHQGAQLSEHERTMVRLWIDSGAVYAGAYAALGTGMIGGFEIVDRAYWESHWYRGSTSP